MFAANDPAPAAEPAGDMGQDAISAMFAANDPVPVAEPISVPSVESVGDMGQDAISALFATNEPVPAVDPEPVVEVTGDLGQDAISALFATTESDPVDSPEPSTGPDEDFVSAILEAKNKSVQKVVTAEDIDDTDMPEVNIVKFDGSSPVEDEDEGDEIVDEFDSIDIDPSLIALII